MIDFKVFSHLYWPSMGHSTPVWTAPGWELDGLNEFKVQNVDDANLPSCGAKSCHEYPTQHKEEMERQEAVRCVPLLKGRPISASYQREKGVGRLPHFNDCLSTCVCAYFKQSDEKRPAYQIFLEWNKTNQ